MEFVDACRAKWEICRAHSAKIGSCTGCMLARYDCGLCYGEDAKEMEPTLMKWRADHPRKTMADHFFECFPNAPKNFMDIPDVCCKRVGLATDDICGEMEDCTACWRREYEESHD